jgi:hypothetical protein
MQGHLDPVDPFPLLSCAAHFPGRHAEQIVVKFHRRSADGDHATVRLLATGEDGRLYSEDLFTKVVWQSAFGRQASPIVAGRTACTR